jgi:hypothetical protein
MRGDNDLKADTLDFNADFFGLLGDIVTAEDPREMMA